MVVKKPSVPLALALLLTACERSPPMNDKRNEATTASVSNVAETSIEATQESRNIPVERVESDKLAFAPPKMTPQAEQSEKGTRNVLLTFAQAIEMKQLGQAWDLLGPADKQKWTKVDFAAIFSDLTKASLAIGDGTTEGAAGSIYYNAPITITGSDTAGRPVRIEGEAVLRRVNDVDGATQEQLRWHFDTFDLRWTH
jgi:hypothetical protein